MLQLDPVTRPLWTVQLLTTEFLLTGYLDAERYRYLFSLFSDFEECYLRNARVEPTGRLKAAPRQLVSWVTVYWDNMVALIPRDEPSTEFALKNNDIFKIPFPGEVYSGPYRLRGTILSPGKFAREFSTYSFLTMRDVTVESLEPGAQWSGLTAPYLLVVGNNHITLPVE